jgi:long-subunit acyl-CoA synthetase (AMP-forming)
MMDRAFVMFGHRKCLGWLPKQGSSQFSRKYKWLSYFEVRRRAHRLGHSIVDVCGVSSGQVVGLMACVSIPWFITDFSCLLKGVGIVPIHKGSSKKCVAHIIRESGMTVLFVSVHLHELMSEAMEQIFRDEEQCQLQHIVWIEDDPEAYSLLIRRRGKEEVPCFKGVDEHKWSDLLSSCTSQASYWHTHFIEAPESIVKLLPTSGSTGLPKLTIVTDSMLRPRRGPLPDSAPAAECGVQLAYDLVRQPTDLLCAGGCIGVYSGSLDRLFQDCRALGPTSFCAAPTLWNGLHREFEAEAAAREAGRGAGESAGDARKGLLLEWRARRLLDFAMAFAMGNFIRKRKY